MLTRSCYAAYEALTRKHGTVCIPPNEVSVDDIVSAIGNMVGFEKVRAASRMNKRVVVFVSDDHLVHDIVSPGISTENGYFIFASPLATTSTKIVLSNVPPFIRNEALVPRCPQGDRRGTTGGLRRTCGQTDSNEWVLFFIIIIFFTSSFVSACRIATANVEMKKVITPRYNSTATLRPVKYSHTT